MRAFLFSIALFLSAAVPVTGAQQGFVPPPNDGYVTVAADVPGAVLDPGQEEALEQSLREYEQRTSNQIAILIVRTLEGYPIEQAAVEVGRQWGVGTAENDNGIVLLIAYEDRELFLATGYGLEGAVPDIVARGIIDRDITPRFRDGDYYGGLVAAIDALQKHIGGEYTAARYASGNAAPPVAWLLFVVFILLDGLGAFLGRTKAWWLGGVLGGAGGLVLTVLFSWWVSIPILVILGLLLDFLVSKTGYRRGRGPWIGRGPWGGGRGGSGGFGGFGGGSFGGGGARGRW